MSYNLWFVVFRVPENMGRIARWACVVLALLVAAVSEVSAAPALEASAHSGARFTFEPTFGAWYGTTDTAHWTGAFAELTTWHEDPKRGKGFVIGLDTVATYSNGSADVIFADSNGSLIPATYNWREERVGAGPAIKYFDNGVSEPWQWQLKLRLLYEHANGDDRKAGYEQRQNTVIVRGRAIITSHEWADV